MDEPAGTFQQAIGGTCSRSCRAPPEPREPCPGKGLTGQAYDGNYFWDTEMYVAAVPDLHGTQDCVQSVAVPAQHAEPRAGTGEGVEQPRRFVSVADDHGRRGLGVLRGRDGADPHQRRYHVRLQKYVNATGDIDFLFAQGAEMLVETARMWATTGSFNEKKGQFCIHSVTGRTSTPRWWTTTRSPT